VTSFAQRVFRIAGIYGLIVLVPQYFMEGRVGRDTPPPITHPEHFYGFIGVAIAWQFCFLAIARDPARLRPVMIPAVLEKLAFGLAAVVLFVQRGLSPIVLGFACLDLVWAVLFTIAYRRTADADVVKMR
jgi:hypothetical protein